MSSQLFRVDFDDGFEFAVGFGEAACVEFRIQVQTHHRASCAGTQRALKDPLIVIDLHAIRFGYLARNDL